MAIFRAALLSLVQTRFMVRAKSAHVQQVLVIFSCLLVPCLSMTATITSARKTHVRVLVALGLQEKAALQWTKPNVFLATVATCWLVILARSTNARVPTAPQRLEMSVLQIMFLRAPRATLAIF